MDFSTLELAAIAIALDEEEAETSRRQRRVERKWGVHPLWKTRNLYGEFNSLCRCLPDDEEKFFVYFRMSKENFDILLNELQPVLRRQQTRFKTPIEAKQRLAVFLRTAAAAAAGRPLKAGAGRVWAWRAHAWGGAGELQLDAVRAPALRRPDHVLVRVRSAALNPLDASMLRGYGASLLGLRRRLDPVEPASPPLVVGREAAGVIERVGPAVGPRLQPGMRVWLVSHPYAAGTLSEQVCVPAACVGEAPCALPDEGGALYAGLTAAAALRGAGGGRHILLLGAGGVGLAALQLAAAAGAHVTVAAKSDQHDLLRELGASDVIDCYAPDYDERLASLPKFDAIIDCAGLGGWEAGNRRWRYSRYVTLTTPLLRWTDERGTLAGSLTSAAALAAQNVAAARAAVDPGCVPSVRWAFFSVNEADIERIRRLAEAGRFRVVVERRFGWREVPAAIEHLERGHARGKILIDFNTD